MKRFPLFVSISILLLLVAGCGGMSEEEMQATLTRSAVRAEIEATQLVEEVRAEMQATETAGAAQATEAAGTAQALMTAESLQATRRAESQATSAAATAAANLPAMLGAVCSREGVEIAAGYSSADTFHPIILLSDSGSRHAWSNSVPSSWQPESVGEAQLVACVGEETERSIEVCRYNGPDITRYRYQVVVQVYDAATGTLRGEATISGSSPRACRQTEPYDLTVLRGDHVSFSDVQEWLSDYVGTPE